MAQTNSVNKSIEIEEDDIEEIKTDKGSFKEAIGELGEAALNRYITKTSNLSHENIKGMIQCNVLNAYVNRNFGYRFRVLDVLVEEKQARVLSANGFGIGKLIEIVKSIQASFEQSQIPEGYLSRLQRR